MAGEQAGPNLTAAQRRALAATLIRAAGDLISTRDHGGEPPEVPTELPDDIGRDAAAVQIGKWLAKLPGAAAYWDNLLVWPENLPR